MVVANLHEKAKKIKRRLTRASLPNPRLIRARTQEAEEKAFRKDLVGDFTIWTKRAIAQQYTEEYVADLLRRANANLKNMVMPKLRPYWLPEE